MSHGNVFFNLPLIFGFRLINSTKYVIFWFQHIWTRKVELSSFLQEKQLLYDWHILIFRFHGTNWYIYQYLNKMSYFFSFFSSDCISTLHSGSISTFKLLYIGKFGQISSFGYFVSMGQNITKLGCLTLIIQV